MVEYGKSYFKSFLGILKILEIIFSIVVIVLESVYTNKRYYYPDIFTEILIAACVGLGVSLLILILSIICGEECDKVLAWQFIIHLAMCIWLLVLCIMLAVKNYNTDSLILAIIGIIDGVIYLLDTIISYKEYKPF